VHPISAVQSEYSLWERGVEEDVLPALDELGIGFVPYSPLGRGFLTGQARRAEDYPEGDYRRVDPRYQGENFARNLHVVDAVRAVAGELRAAPAQVALAWLLHQRPSIVPIPGTKRVATLEQNAAAAELALTPAQLARLDRDAPRGATAGPRYANERMAAIDKS
jgi:aryl-alcohol dehydrogenase-like predicted oxidoreductase